MKAQWIWLTMIIITVAAGCETKKLPYLGEPDVVNKVIDGKEKEEKI